MSAAEAVRPVPAGGLLAGASAARTSNGHVHLLLVVCVAASVAAHGWMAVGGGHGAGWSLVMAAMSVACAVCLVDLVRRREAHGPVRMALGMAVAMAVVHVLMLPLMAGGQGGTQHAHHAGGGTAPGAVAASTGGADHGTMLLPIALELVAAGLASARLRHRFAGSRARIPGFLR